MRSSKAIVPIQQRHIQSRIKDDVNDEESLIGIGNTIKDDLNKSCILTRSGCLIRLDRELAVVEG